MNGWAPKNVELQRPAISGVVTNSPITVEFPIYSGGALNMVLKIKAAGVTVVGAITAKLQTALGADWVDSKTVSVTATGDFYIKLNIEVAADQTFLPLLSRGRVVVTTTNAGDAMGITSVEVVQEL